MIIPQDLFKPFTIFLITGATVIIALNLIEAFRPNPEVRTTIEARKLIEAQVKLEELKLEQERVIYQQDRMQAREARYNQMTGEQIMEENRINIIRRMCDGDKRCVLDRL